MKNEIIKFVIVLLFITTIIAICLAENPQFLISGAESLESGQIEEAISYFKKAATVDEIEPADLHILLSAIYNMVGRYTEAIDEARLALKLNPVLREGIKIILGASYKENLEYPDIEIYKKSLPHNLKAKVFFVLGIILQRNGVWKKAIKAYRTAIELEPDFQWLRYNIIDKLYEHKDEISLDNLAIEEYIEIIKRCPSAENYKALGDIYFDKDKDKAIGFYMEAVKLDQNYAEAYRAIGGAFADSGRYEEALRYLKKAIDLDPDNLEYHYTLGLLYVALGRLSDAVKEYNLLKDKQIYVGFSPEYLEYAIIYSRYFGKIQKVKGGIQIGFEIEYLPPRDKNKKLWSYFDRAIDYKNKGMYEEAIEEYKKSLKVKETIFANYELGTLYIRYGDCNNGLRYLTKARDLANDRGILYGALAMAYCACDKNDEAIQLLESFLQRNPRDIYVLYTLGEILFESGNWNKVVEIYEKLKDVDGIIFGLVEDKYGEAKSQLGAKQK